MRPVMDYFCRSFTGYSPVEFILHGFKEAYAYFNCGIIIYAGGIDVGFLIDENLRIVLFGKIAIHCKPLHKTTDSIPCLPSFHQNF
jgi:hypothetical protein